MICDTGKPEYREMYLMLCDAGKQIQTQKSFD